MKRTTRLIALLCALVLLAALAGCGKNPTPTPRRWRWWFPAH